MPPIQLAYAKFWDGFDPEHNWFTDLLRERFEVQISDTPEVVIYSVYAGEMPPGSYVRVFQTPENVVPDMEQCDYALSFEYDDDFQHPRHLRLPNYVRSCQPEDLVKPEDHAERVGERPRFCNFVYKHRVRFRRAFFRKLSRYRRVDAPGKEMNNMPPIGGHRDPKKSRYAVKREQEKIEFLRDYKFTVAFENESHPGYTTEKLVDAMLGGTIPIYWGNPEVNRDFNTRSFINYHDHEAAVRAHLPGFLRRVPGLGALLERWVVTPLAVRRVVRHVIEVDRDPGLYRRYLEEPWYHDNRPSDVMSRERLLDRFEEIFRSVGD